jgi:hypothetical protein
MKPSSRKPSKVSALTLAKQANTCKTSIEFGLESFLKDPKIEKALEDISSSFKKIEESKQKAEYLQEFQKCEKTLSSLIEKLQHHQESIPKYEETLKKILDKRPLLKEPDKDDPNFKEDKKKIEDAIAYIETTLKTSKEKLEQLAEKLGVLRKRQANLQVELEQFSLLAGFKNCEKEVKKLDEQLESVCGLSASLSKSNPVLPEATKTGIKTFIPGFRERLKNCNGSFAAVESYLGRLLEGAAPPSAAILSAIPSPVAVSVPAAAAAAVPASPQAEVAAAPISSQPSSASAPVVISAAAQAVVAGIVKPEGVAAPLQVLPGSEAANEAVVLRAGNG